MSFRFFCDEDKVSFMKVTFKVLHINRNSLSLLISIKKIFFSSVSFFLFDDKDMNLFNISLMKASLCSLSIDELKNTSINLYAMGL